jgi:hydrogenase/urease accessory protein HupE
MKIAKQAAIVLSLALPATLQAHPGHGWSNESFSFLHYFTEPEHGLAALLVLLPWIAVRNRARKGR